MTTLFWRLARSMFLTIGSLSEGIRVGKRFGFSSGEMLDYVYENEAHGWGPLGRWLDRIYLDSVGWRGIRERRLNLVRTLSAIVLTRRAVGLSTRIVDIAAGPGRYLLDLAESLGGDDLSIECRDFDRDALTRGRALAARRGLSNVAYVWHDALDAASLQAMASADIIVVSGLYEIITDVPAIRASLGAIRRALAPGGVLVLTGQPHHPQLQLIGNLLTHRDGSPWRMQLRSTATLEGWCHAAGFTDIHTQPDSLGIFSVSVARAADLEAGEVLERLVPVDLELAHPGAGGAALAPAQHVLDG
jgi:SAM-dependent methyltransferase